MEQEKIISHKQFKQYSDKIKTVVKRSINIYKQTSYKFMNNLKHVFDFVP